MKEVKTKIRERFMETYFRQKRLEIMTDSQIKIAYHARKFIVFINSIHGNIEK